MYWTVHLVKGRRLSTMDDRAGALLARSVAEGIHEASFRPFAQTLQPPAVEPKPERLVQSSRAFEGSGYRGPHLKERRLTEDGS